MRELAQEVLSGKEAWVVGGAVRDEALGRDLVDLDIACREPRNAAREYAKRSGGDPFPLSERHGAWRVALEDGRAIGVMEPRLNYFARQREPVGTPAIHSTAAGDLYFSLMQVEPNGRYASVRLMTMPAVIWLWIAAPLFLLSAVVILWPDRSPGAPARVAVREGEAA